MSKIASLVVDNPSRKVEGLFDYLVPDEFQDIVNLGMRVVVPFGAGNRYLEGIIVELKEESLFKGLKEIIDVVDNEEMLDKELIDLAHFLSREYNSSLYNSFKTIMPAGINLKETISVKLIKQIENEEFSTDELRVINNLNEDGFIEFNELKKKIENIKRSTIFSLEKKGIIEINREMKQQVNIKKDMVYCVKGIEESQRFIDEYGKKVKRQAEVLKELLNEKELLTQTEIMKKYSCSASVINGLEQKGLIEKTTKEIYRNPFTRDYHYKRVELNNEQIIATKSIINTLGNKDNTILIHGVTGCGKTEIYLKSAEEVIKEGNGAIILVPEIALTPQTLERFKGRFGDKVAVIHSRLSDGERYDEWRRIKEGSVQVVVGARSAVFAPVKNLKLIVIDEEHEYTYKSDFTPKYKTHDVASFRASYNGGVLVLGSATPSMESYFKAKNGEYKLIEIRKRVDNKTLPRVRIINMKDELAIGNKSILSRELYDGIKENLKNGEQTILFLNRRGYSTFVSCRSCGFVCKCSRCDVSLTYHNKFNKLICHYCGIEMNIPVKCPKCGSKYIRYFGTGTEKIEVEVKKYFPSARIIRMDMDTTRKKGSHEKLYNQFKNKEADILIGTQMVSKGMDFEDVTLVGVIAADTSLNIPDFRSSERTFQLLTQVAGRAGRGEKSGRVIVQTYDPEHYSIVYAKNHDYNKFYEKEIDIRQTLNNPPFSDILYVLLYSTNEKDLIDVSMGIRNEILTDIKDEKIEILGPVPCSLSKLKNNFRWQFILKGNAKDYFIWLDQKLDEYLSGSNIKYSIDINPYNMI